MSNNLILIIMLLELLVKHDAQVKIMTIDSAGFTCSLDRHKHRASKPTGPPSKWFTSNSNNIIINIRLFDMHIEMLITLAWYSENCLLPKRT
jgi:hypothetical protein